MKNNHTLKFDENTKLYIGDYFRAYKSKYYTLVKEVIENQRNYEYGCGEYYITMLRVDIFNKEEKLLAEDSIVPINKIISGALAKYIPDLNYDPTYLGAGDPYLHYAEYKIWKDMTNRCFDCTNSVFPYIGALGTTVCDRWRCFEYFLADFKHIIGYAEYKDSIYANKHYIVDLYDIQKHIHPSNRVYAPGYVKLKPFKESDICKYYNINPAYNNYPKDLNITAKYRNGEINIKETLFKKQTGANFKMNLDEGCYYYDAKVGYQPLVTMVNPYMTYAYNYYNTYYNNQSKPIMKEMCVIIDKKE